MEELICLRIVVCFISDSCVIIVWFTTFVLDFLSSLLLEHFYRLQVHEEQWH